MRSTTFAAALAIAAAHAAAGTPAAAQLFTDSCTLDALVSTCTASATVSATVGTAAQLQVDETGADFGEVTAADFDAGQKDALGVFFSVTSNAAWSLTMAAQTSTWTGGNGDKPASDLLWQLLSAGDPYAAISTTPQSLLSGQAPTDGYGDAVVYRSLWSYLSDEPGSYSILVDFTLSAP